MFLYTFSPACLTESSLLVYQFERSFFLHTLSIAVKNWWRHNRWYKGSSTCIEYSTRSDGARRSDGKKSQGKIYFSMRKRLRVVGRSTASKEEEPELGRPWPGTYYLLTKNQMVRGLAPVLFGITHRISTRTPETQPYSPTLLLFRDEDWGPLGAGALLSTWRTLCRKVVRDQLQPLINKINELRVSKQSVPTSVVLPWALH